MNCPACDYDLAGLPEEHRCPECGFVYDAHTVVIDFRTKRASWLQLANVLVSVGSSWFLMRRGGVDVRWMVVAMVLLLGALLWGWYRIQVAGAERGWCVLRKRGTLIEHPSRHPWRGTWAELAQARISGVRGRFRIRNKQGRIVFDAPYRHFGSYKNAKRCAKEMSGLAKVYCDEPGELATAPQSSAVS